MFEEDKNRSDEAGALLAFALDKNFETPKSSNQAYSLLRVSISEYIYKQIAQMTLTDIEEIRLDPSWENFVQLEMNEEHWQTIIYNVENYYQVKFGTGSAVYLFYPEHVSLGHILDNMIEAIAKIFDSSINTDQEFYIKRWLDIKFDVMKTNQ